MTKRFIIRLFFLVGFFLLLSPVNSNAGAFVSFGPGYSAPYPYYNYYYGQPFYGAPPAYFNSYPGYYPGYYRGGYYGGSYYHRSYGNGGFYQGYRGGGFHGGGWGGHGGRR